MLHWFITNIVGILEILALALIGAFAAFGYWGGKDSTRQEKSDQIADGLIDRLQKTVDQNTKDMAAQTVRIDNQQKEIHQLQGQNDAYLKIITLRDPATLKVFEEAPEIYLIARETNEFAREIKEMVAKQAQATTSLTAAMEDFINRLPPLTAAMTP